MFVALPLWRLRRRGPIDVVVTYDPYGSGIPGLILKTLLGAKLIVQIMGDYHRLDPNDELLGEYGKLRKTGGAVKKFVMKIVFRLCVAAADAIKVLNRDQERFVRARWPKKTVYRFADFAATGYFGSLTTFEGDYLLAVGHPFHRKGVDVLIRAFARIADRHPHMHLRILGYAPKNELRQLSRAGGSPPPDRVRPGGMDRSGGRTDAGLLCVRPRGQIRGHGPRAARGDGMPEGRGVHPDQRRGRLRRGRQDRDPVRDRRRRGVGLGHGCSAVGSRAGATDGTSGVRALEPGVFRGTLCGALLIHDRRGRHAMDPSGVRWRASVEPTGSGSCSASSNPAGVGKMWFDHVVVAKVRRQSTPRRHRHA